MRSERVRYVALPDESIEELRAVVQAEPQPERGKYGPRLAKWMGNTTGLIASGVIKAEVATAVPHITETINKFLGWM